MIRALKIARVITDRSDEAVNMYLKELSHTVPLTAEQEMNLARKIQQGGTEGIKARNMLVKANLLFVISVANQYSGPNVPMADLIQEGNMGLVTAASKFDSERGVKFISFAVWHIRQRILKALSEQGRTIRMPLNKELLLGRIKRATDEYLHRYNEMPSESELAYILGVNVDQLKMTIAGSVDVCSLNKKMAGTDDLFLVDTLCGDSKSEADYEMNAESMGIDIRRTMKMVLCPYEAKILSLYFGIGHKPMTCREIAAVSGMSDEGVRQKIHRCLERLKDSECVDTLRQYIA